MLQKTFEIKGPQNTFGSRFIEAGEKYLACWSKASGDAGVNAFEFFQFEPDDFISHEQLFETAAQKSDILQTSSASTFFVWNCAEAVCVPSKFYNDILAADFINITHGEMMHPYLHSQTEGDITIVSRVKPEVQHAAEKFFNGAQFSHAWVQILKQQPNADGKALFLNFYPGTFTIAAFANGSLHLIQSRKYQSPEDVLYYVLNFFRHYEWVADEAKIYASGLIDPGSKLFDTLHQYLSHFETAASAREVLASGDFKNYPQHFFLPFANYEA